MKDEPPSSAVLSLEAPLHPFEIRAITPHHSALIASRDFQRGEVISEFYLNGISDQPSRYSIQINEDLHGLLVPVELTYMNHACEPCAAIQVDHLRVVALRDISMGEEITFFYPSLEWRMAEPFRCVCGSERCLQWIEGAYALPDDVLSRYMLSPAIRGLLARRGFVEDFHPDSVRISP